MLNPLCRTMAALGVWVWFPGMCLHLPGMSGAGVPASHAHLPGAAMAANNDIITLRNPQNWTVHADVRLESYGGFFDNTRVRVGANFHVARAAVVFPLIPSSASHTLHLGDMTSELRVDSRVFDTEPTILKDYQAGEQMGRWDMENATGRIMRLSVELPMTLHEVVFNEERANRVNWPKEKWSPLAESALTSQMFVEVDDPDVQRLVREWTRGNPRAARPAPLAKHLAARVIEHFQPNGQGIVSERSGWFAGMEVNGAGSAARTGRGSPYDMAALLCAVYRAAGLPARVVIGYDIPASLGREAGIFRTGSPCDADLNNDPSIVPILHAWVEFLLVDESAGAPGTPGAPGASGKEWWIPVDPLRQRRFGSRPPPLDRAWLYFGHHECLDNIAPLSFHFHPPTTVIAANAPALWGWLPTPRAPSSEQVISFRANHTPQRGGKRPNR